MAEELEIKLEADGPQTLDEIARDREIRDLAETKTDWEMESVYYDTGAGDLTRRKWTLRRRRENDRQVIAMKTAGDGLIRGEWEYEGDLADAAERLCAMGAPAELRQILSSPVEPVCGASFSRRAILLRFDDGSTAELALDLGCLFRGDKSAPLAEAELELKSGGPEAMLRLAEELKDHYGLRPQEKSKFLRAREL